MQLSSPSQTILYFRDSIVNDAQDRKTNGIKVFKPEARTEKIHWLKRHSTLFVP